MWEHGIVVLIRTSLMISDVEKLFFIHSYSKESARITRVDDEKSGTPRNPFPEITSIAVWITSLWIFLCSHANISPISQMTCCSILPSLTSTCWPLYLPFGIMVSVPRVPSCLRGSEPRTGFFSRAACPSPQVRLPAGRGSI